MTLTVDSTDPAVMGEGPEDTVIKQVCLVQYYDAGFPYSTQGLLAAPLLKNIKLVLHDHEISFRSVHPP